MRISHCSSFLMKPEKIRQIVPVEFIFLQMPFFHSVFQCLCKTTEMHCNFVDSPFLQT